jgi:hypothetical protein
MKTTDMVLICSGMVVGTATVIFPQVTGYGTILFQLVVFSAWRIVALLSSDRFADLHHGVLFSVAFLINLAAFFLVAAPIWAFCRNRASRFGSVLLFSWLLFYLACLFFLFPATDGP